MEETPYYEAQIIERNTDYIVFRNHNGSPVEKTHVELVGIYHQFKELLGIVFSMTSGTRNFEEINIEAFLRIWEEHGDDIL